MATKPLVLFVCTHNSARSQMAEAWLRSLYGDRYEVASAGTEPSQVHPLAIKVMAEVGIDMTGHRSKSIDEFLARHIDLVVTVCDHAREVCPVIPGARKTHHQSFPDPSVVAGSEEERLSAFRDVRDRIRAWIETFFGRE